MLAFNQEGSALSVWGPLHPGVCLPRSSYWSYLGAVGRAAGLWPQAGSRGAHVMPTRQLQGPVCYGSSEEWLPQWEGLGREAGKGSIAGPGWPQGPPAAPSPGTAGLAAPLRAPRLCTFSAVGTDAGRLGQQVAKASQLVSAGWGGCG